MIAYVYWWRRAVGLPLTVAVLAAQALGVGIIAFTVGIFVTAWLRGW